MAIAVPGPPPAYGIGRLLPEPLVICWVRARVIGRVRNAHGERQFGH